MQDFDIAGVAIISLIILPLLQFFKPLFPNAPGNAWRVAAFLLGLIGALVKARLLYGPITAWEYGAWVGVILSALLAALASGKVYDESIGKPA